MKKWKIVWALLLCLLFAGCAKETEEESVYKLYYVNFDKETIESVSFEPKSEDTVSMIQEVMDKLSNKEEETEAHFPEETIVGNYELMGDVLRLDFSSSYRKLDPVYEILCRAAVVKNFVQIPNVNYVQVTIEGEELLDSKGNVIGIMSSDSFLENSGKEIMAYQYTELELYFANEAGDKLVKEKRSVYYSGNSPIEKVAVAQLIRGPKGEGHFATLPSSTRIIGVSVADGIAYVNLDQRFVTEALPVQEALPIYSIANTLIELGNVSKVSISVNGDTKMIFQESMDLTKMYEMNYDLIENEES